MLRLDKDVVQLAQLPTEERRRGLKRIIPCATIKAILKQAAAAGRTCSRLPDWFMVWFVIGLGLFSTDGYRQIYRWLQPFRRQGTPGRSTLCEGRHRLGVAPMCRLVATVVHLLAGPKTTGAFYQGLRLMAIDGWVANLPDKPANARVFGRPQGGRTPGAFPQARVVSLCEVATHVLWRSLIKPLRCGETTMPRCLLRFLQENMLLLCDRNFLGYRVLTQIVQRRAHVLARLKSTFVFRRRRRFPDGSYLSKVYPSSWARHGDRDGILVRVIEYTFNDSGRPGSGQRHRLLTTLLDWQQHPAPTLILLYHQRWEQELAIDEVKTHQGRLLLRSQTPAGVVQEIHGLLLAHYVVRKLMFDAAATVQLPPLRLSFTNTLKILRTRLPTCPKGRRQRQAWYVDLVAEVAEQTLEERRNRVNPRVIKQKVKKWPSKREKHRRFPQPRKKIEESIRVFR